ncbi:MAG: sensor histidine kinase [Exilispira sp.]
MRKIKIYLWIKLFLAISIFLLIIMIFSYLFIQNFINRQFSLFLSEDVDKEKEHFIEQLKEIIEKNDANYSENITKFEKFVEIQNLLKENRYIVSCVIFLNRNLVFYYSKNGFEFIPPPPKSNNFSPMPNQFGKERRFTPPKLKAGFFMEQYIFRPYPLRLYTINILFFNNAAREFIEKIRFAFLLFYVGLLFISLPVSTLISKQFTKPIRKIIEKTIKLSNGNFEEIIDNNRSDEIGILIDAFNKLSIQLKNDYQFRKTVTSQITHDISTPINIIRSYLYGINDGIIDISTQTIMTIDSEIERINELVDQINLFSSNKDINMENIPLILINEEIEIYIDKILYLFNKDKIEITKNLKDEVFFRIRRNHLRSLIENLLKNSALHNVSNIKKIEVSLFSGNEAIEYINNLSQYLIKNNYSFFSLKKDTDDKKNIRFSIIIRDNGIGIDEKDLPNIFERFYKGNNGIKNINSSGIGLSIVKEICLLYNINLEIYSSLKEGTSIILNFYQ